jgi:hypothetical protein
MWKHIINTTDYTTFELVTFGIGCYMWAIVYGIVIYDIFKRKRVDIPVLAVCGNIAWEFWWGLIFRTNMGPLLQWSYAIWFFLDLIIVYGAFKYGAKQEVTNQRKYHWLIMISVIASWTVIFGFFIPRFDDNIGAFTGWILNTMMSIGFVMLKTENPQFGTNRWVAVCKFLGTGMCNFVCFSSPSLNWNKTLLSLCIIFAIFDLVYIYLVFTGPKAGENLGALATSQVAAKSASEVVR